MTTTHADPVALSPFKTLLPQHQNLESLLPTPPGLRTPVLELPETGLDRTVTARNAAYHLATDCCQTPFLPTIPKNASPRRVFRRS
jgi:hypothetical protein